MARPPNTQVITSGSPTRDPRGQDPYKIAPWWAYARYSPAQILTDAAWRLFAQCASEVITELKASPED